MGVQANQRISEEKGLFLLRFLDFSGALQALWKRVRQEKGEKGRKLERVPKLAQKLDFEPFLPLFSHCAPISRVRPQSMFRRFSSPFCALSTKWICTRFTTLQTTGLSIKSDALHPPNCDLRCLCKTVRDSVARPFLKTTLTAQRDSKSSI